MTFKGHQGVDRHLKGNLLYQINDIKYCNAFRNTVVSCGSDSKIKFWDINEKILKDEYKADGKENL
jgi:hypothetical protein